MHKLKLSTMTGKLSGITGINTSSLDNEYCQAMSQRKDNVICRYCYSNRNLSTFRKICREGWKNNGVILSSGFLEDWQIPRFSPDEIVRFNGYGELINDTHLLNCFKICSTNPNVQFAIWTKRFRMVQKYLDQKPANLILIYSNPYLDKSSVLPKGFDKTFNVKTKKSSARINCSGACLDCKKCYKADNRTTVIYERIK
jgi:hypothetical protein